MMKDDIAKVYFTEEELQAKVRELGRQITEDYKDAKEDIYCVGILKGASVFYTDLVRTFVARSSSETIGSNPIV